MDKKIVVFDFDKTLTDKDTLFGFLVFASKKTLFFPFRILLYLFFMVIAKFGLISNDRLKKIGIVFFLKNRDNNYIKTVSAKYSQRIKYNDLYNNYDFNTDDEVYVVSASFRDYLHYAFPDHINIIGSELNYENNKIRGLKFNCYKGNKVKALNNAGILKIDELYTDSFKDIQMARISKEIIVVKGDKLIKCQNIDDFRRLFGK